MEQLMASNDSNSTPTSSAGSGKNIISENVDPVSKIEELRREVVDFKNKTKEEIEQQESSARHLQTLVVFGFLVLLVMVATLLIMVAFEQINAMRDKENQIYTNTHPRYER